MGFKVGNSNEDKKWGKKETFSKGSSGKSSADPKEIVKKSKEHKE